MKIIYCDIHMFELHQRVYIADTETGKRDCASFATISELPEIISALCKSNDVHKVILSGNSIYCSAVSEDILTYSKNHYNQNEIEVEVVK